LKMIRAEVDTDRESADSGPVPEGHSLSGRFVLDELRERATRMNAGK
jgi:hypothetical protein